MIAVATENSPNWTAARSQRTGSIRPIGAIVTELLADYEHRLAAVEPGAEQKWGPEDLIQ